MSSGASGVSGIPYKLLIAQESVYASSVFELAHD